MDALKAKPEYKDENGFSKDDVLVVDKLDFTYHEVINVGYIGKLYEEEEKIIPKVQRRLGIVATTLQKFHHNKDGDIMAIQLIAGHYLNKQPKISLEIKHNMNAIC